MLKRSLPAGLASSGFGLLALRTIDTFLNILFSRDFVVFASVTGLDEHQ